MSFGDDVKLAQQLQSAIYRERSPGASDLQIADMVARALAGGFDLPKLTLEIEQLRQRAIKTRARELRQEHAEETRIKVQTELDKLTASGATGLQHELWARAQRIAAGDADVSRGLGYKTDAEWEQLALTEVRATKPHLFMMMPAPPASEAPTRTARSVPSGAAQLAAACLANASSVDALDAEIAKVYREAGAPQTTMRSNGKPWSRTRSVARHLLEYTPPAERQRVLSAHFASIGAGTRRAGPVVASNRGADRRNGGR